MGGAGCAEAARGLKAVVIGRKGNERERESGLDRERGGNSGAFHAWRHQGEPHGTALVEEVMARGAGVVVLPELFTCGYQPNKNVWKSAEAREKPTARWLMGLGRRLGIYIGDGSVEADGSDLFNVFILADRIINSPPIFD